MSIAAIHNILDTRLKTLDPLPPLELENGILDTSKNLPLWLRASFLPAPSGDAGIGTNQQTIYRGDYQVDCFTLLGQGAVNGNTAADSIVALFKKGSVLTDGTFVVLIKMSSAMSGVPMADGKYYAIPVSINWMCYAI